MRSSVSASSSAGASGAGPARDFSQSWSSMRSRQVSAFAGAAVSANGAAPAGRAAPKRAERKKAAGGGPDQIESPLQGNMWKVVVKQGDTVEEGQLLCIIEAMKMENEITAHKAGTVAELPIAEGAAVTVGATLAVIKS